jgi:catechol 2,3-dioxygenase-like lactoylglutathione lyase family enzyme
MSGGPPTVAGFHHVQLAMPARGEEEAERFYAGLLGFERVPKPAALEARGGCWFRSGEAEVHLGVEDPFRPAAKAHPAFQVSDLDGLAARLEAAGVHVRWDDLLLDGVRRRCYASDPFGNRVELVEDGGVSPPRVRPAPEGS